MKQLFVYALRNLKRGAVPLLTTVTLICIVAGLSACDTSGDGANNNAAPNDNRSTLGTGLNPVAGETGFYVDSVNGQVPRRDTPIIVDAKVLPAFGVGGWAVDQPAQREAGGVIITIDGKTDMPTTYGSERPDVVKFLKSAGYMKSGFTGTISTATLEKGSHTLTFKVLTADSTGYYEPKDQIRIEIRK